MDEAEQVQNLNDPDEPVEELPFDEDSENELPPQEKAEVEEVAQANPGDPVEGATAPGES